MTEHSQVFLSILLNVKCESFDLLCSVNGINRSS